MRRNLFKFILTLNLLFSISFSGKCIDSLKYTISLNYYKDLSDTYGGGDLLTGEFAIAKYWYGMCISLGHFQSHSVFTYQVFVEELNKTISIPFDELSIMQTGSLSVKMIPIKNKSISTDLVFGLSMCRGKNLRFNTLEYSYSLTNDKFNYLYRDYKLVVRNHFGYQFGLNVSFYFTKKIGVQLNSRIQDLSNGGTFFFVGGGLCFKH